MAKKARKAPEQKMLIIGKETIVAEAIGITIDEQHGFVLLHQTEGKEPSGQLNRIALDQLAVRELHEFLGDMLERWEVDRAVKRQELVRTW